ncbi:hypothetical protein CMO96_03630 [Candidatus Woesebacteria bacterium]|nr:hypothetical protein [Candidatus Woesebacteria bacterium]
MDISAHKDNLRNKLKLRHLDTTRSFNEKHPHAKAHFSKKGFDLGQVRRHSAKLLTAGALSGALLLSPPKVYGQELAIPEPLAAIMSATTDSATTLPQEPKSWLTDQLSRLLPPIKDRWALPFINPDREKEIGQVIRKSTNIPAVATLEGEHLNTTYGYTGAEQHLRRFPGDTIAKHDEFRESGMAPARGAWGWFTEKGKLTPEAIQREKYYLAVQTLYLPDWNKRWNYLKDWYKWRKVMMVNVENGNAVVAVVGDAGPASWTGKHFGGSPEVMNELGGPRYRKGRVLVYFVDDPENKIPLGPVTYSHYNKLETPTGHTVWVTQKSDYPRRGG